LKLIKWKAKPTGNVIYSSHYRFFQGITFDEYLDFYKVLRFINDVDTALMFYHVAGASIDKGTTSSGNSPSLLWAMFVVLYYLFSSSYISVRWYNFQKRAAICEFDCHIVQPCVTVTCKTQFAAMCTKHVGSVFPRL